MVVGYPGDSRVKTSAASPCRPSPPHSSLSPMLWFANRVGEPAQVICVVGAEAAEAKVNVCRGSAMSVCLAVNDDHADSVAGVLPAVPHSR